MRWLLCLVSADSNDQRRALLSRRLLALGALTLVGATYRLWTPQQVFPQVPLAHAALAVPAWFQWAGLVAMLAGLLAALVASDRGRGPRLATVGLLTFAIATVAMIVLDQQRCQPWAYQFVLLALVLARCDAASAMGLARLLVVSFYAYSALTKFDYSFLHTLGQQFLAALVGVFGQSVEHWDPTARLIAASLFPMGELLVAVGLCFQRTRGVALVGAVALHVLLLVILGPWGLDHRPGVLVWNAWFIAEVLFLFGPAKWWPASADGSASLAARVPWDVRAIVTAALVLPVLSPIGSFDMWPGWGLYASCSQRVRLLVHRGAAEELPEELRPFLEDAGDARDPWLVLRLDRWALASLAAPIYPQNRLQLGVAQAVIDRYGLMGRARVVRFELAERLTGRRNYDELASPSEFAAAQNDYWVNCRPSARFQQTEGE